LFLTHDHSSSSLPPPTRKEFSHETLNIYQFGGEDENGIIHLHIYYLICTKSIVLGQNLGKFRQQFVSVQLICNDLAEFDNSLRDYRRSIVVVQHSSYLHVNYLICIIMEIIVLMYFANTTIITDESLQFCTDLLLDIGYCVKFLIQVQPNQIQVHTRQHTVHKNSDFAPFSESYPSKADYGLYA
jgi:hypothetical protein